MTRGRASRPPTSITSSIGSRGPTRDGAGDTGGSGLGLSIVKAIVDAPRRRGARLQCRRGRNDVRDTSSAFPRYHPAHRGARRRKRRTELAPVSTRASERWRAMLANWTFDPAVVFGLGVTGVLYVRADRRVHRERGDRRFPRARRREFLAGLRVLFIALESPIDRFSHVVLGAHGAAPAAHDGRGAALGARGPVTLALLASSPTGRRRLSAALRRPPLRTLSDPTVAWALFFGALWGSHFTSPVRGVAPERGIHALEHVAYVVTAVLFWMPVIGRDPSPAGLSASCADPLSLLRDGVDGVPGPGPLQREPRPVPNLWSHRGAAKALADQRIGGTLMWLGGDGQYRAGPRARDARHGCGSTSREARASTPSCSATERPLRPPGGPAA